MPTAVVSDLHLGTRSGRDVLRREAARDALFEATAHADRLVLLGDVLELRESPVGDVLDAAEPFFAALNEAFAGKQVLISAGNHDHQIASALIDERRLDGRRPLALEERMEPPAHGPLGRIAAAMPDVELTLAYPGVWVRDDVYAMHGHYLDAHNTVPTLERLAVAVTQRVTREADPRTPDEYEAALQPVYSLIYSLAQSAGSSRITGSSPSIELWQRLSGDGARQTVASRVLGVALVPGAVALLNRSGLGDFKADLSGVELRRAGLRGMAEAVRRLEIDAAHVIFGHTHRAGPFDGDEEGWKVTATGSKLVNSGSWIWEPAFVGREGKRSPYFPGTCVFVDDEGPPRLERLLEDVPPLSAARS